ncbi:MAG: alpha/beta hydrolase, partial [Gemmatimonadetes bacterium]|nr:alpha/beta hydrolase [Gemmatimonadota bacterium]
MEATELTVHVGDRVGDVSALWTRPPDADVQYVFGHGAGAGMRHSFMEALTERLVARRVAVFRYQFPYMEAGKRRPDVPRVLEATVRAAVARAADVGDGLPQFAGGKSMGGRMSSRTAAGVT